MPRLKMLRGPFPGDDIQLEEDVITIGRGRKNTIIIQDNEVSRVHCRLVRVLDDYEIHDLGSTNGTFVNGQQIDESGWLLSGRCLVELGDSITLEYLPTTIATGTAPPQSKVAQALAEKVYYLVIEQESQEQPEIYILDRSTITIGRDFDNDITLDEPEVSRHHMRIVLGSEGYMVEDLNTMNGTTVNHEKVINQQMLRTNDLVGIGTSVHIWYTDDPNGLLSKLGTKERPRVNDGDSPPELRTVDRRPADDARETQVNIHLGHGLEVGELEGSVFLVHAREEWNAIGSHIYTYLQDNHIGVFTEQYLTPETDDWHAAIELALAESPCLLAIISERSVEVPHVIRTIRHFLAREKSVLLLRYGRLEHVPLILRNMPVLKFDPKNPEKTYRMILAELRRIGL